jgi:hypothetical protein
LRCVIGALTAVSSTNAQMLRADTALTRRPGR